MLFNFLNSCHQPHVVRYDINPPAIQKQQWHSREAQIELPLIECECENPLDKERDFLKHETKIWFLKKQDWYLFIWYFRYMKEGVSIIFQEL